MEKKLNVVSACFEAMLDQRFHIYAGGLGVVQAGLLKSAGRGDWPVNLYGLGILWSRGYYGQKIDPKKRRMEVEYKKREYGFLEDTGVRVAVDINGRPNTIKVWHLPSNVFKTVPCFFLDTDLKENDELARSITQNLYGGNEETRLAQEIVLGIGGIRAFEALGIPVDIYHGQEGHTLLIAAELLSRNLKLHASFKEACQATRQQFVFTTHTPELAGNEEHHLDLMMRMGCLPGITREEALSLAGDPFNMTVAALRLAKKANAVSKLHRDISNRMWSWVENRCPLISITNGVDEDWQFPEFLQVITPEALQPVKEKYKERLLKYVEKRTGKKFKKDVLTIVWARRFTDYKRPWLMFMDWPWLKKLLQDDKIQIIVAGKPHPHDQPAINYYNWVYEKSLEVPNLAILAGFEYEQNKLLKAGCDVWLQTPRRPREACGTSWMSASALVMSSRDGGILESSPENHFLFGADHLCREGEQDTIDFQDFKRTLVNDVMDIYYNDKPGWYRKMLAAILEKRQQFSSDRMLGEYIDLLYFS